MDYFPGNWGNPVSRNTDTLLSSSDYLGEKSLHNNQSQKTQSQFFNPIQKTQSPIVTGTSVIALQYKDGVILAADNLGYYFNSPFSLSSPLLSLSLSLSLFLSSLSLYLSLSLFLSSLTLSFFSR
jgi:hypothetical protein